MSIAVGNYAKLDIGRFERCPICHDYGYFGGNISQHKCKPAFYCEIDSDDYSYGQIVFADDYENAAERFVCEWDADDYHSVASNNEDVTVFVIATDKHDRISELKEDLERLTRDLNNLLLKPSLDELEQQDVASMLDDVTGLERSISELKASFKTFKVTGEVVPSYSAEEVTA